MAQHSAAPAWREQSRPCCAASAAAHPCCRPVPPPSPPPQAFPTGAAFLPAAGFHTGLAAICGLYLLFWLKLNLMQVSGVCCGGAGVAGPALGGSSGPAAPAPRTVSHALHCPPANLSPQTVPVLMGLGAVTAVLGSATLKGGAAAAAAAKPRKQD